MDVGMLVHQLEQPQAGIVHVMPGRRAGRKPPSNDMDAHGCLCTHRCVTPPRGAVTWVVELQYATSRGARRDPTGPVAGATRTAAWCGARDGCQGCVVSISCSHDRSCQGNADTGRARHVMLVP